jgi:hypothetical protein
MINAITHRIRRAATDGYDETETSL